MERAREVYMGPEDARVEVRVVLTASLGVANVEDFVAKYGDVTLSLRSGATSVQTYCTPGQARALADALYATANDVDGHDDDRVAEMRQDRGV